MNYYKIVEDGKVKWCLPPEDKTPVEHLAKASEFISSLLKIPWMQNDGNPNPDWRLFETFGEVLDLVDSVPCEYTEECVDEWDRVWDAIYFSAKAAERDVASGSAWDAVRSLGQIDPTLFLGYRIQDSALYASSLIVEDILDSKHLEHAKKRMEVWKKGYGLYCDIEGVFYVYKRY